MSERLMMEGRLERLKRDRIKLRLRIEGNCTAVRSGLNTALTEVDELDVPVIAEQMDELVSAWGELQGVNIKVARIEQELG